MEGCQTSSFSLSVEGSLVIPWLFEVAVVLDLPLPFATTSPHALCFPNHRLKGLCQRGKWHLTQIYVVIITYPPSVGLKCMCEKFIVCSQLELCHWFPIFSSFHSKTSIRHSQETLQHSLCLHSPSLCLVCSNIILVEMWLNPLLSLSAVTPLKSLKQHQK